MTDRNKFHRWLHLIHLTEEMNHLIKDERVSIDQLRILLASVDEVFREAADPVAEFPSFALRRFCKDLSRCLEAMESKEIVKSLVR